MLRKRIIPVVYIKSGKAVQSFGFQNYKIIGSVKVVLQYLERWGADEIIVLDIDATKEKRLFDLELLTDIAKIVSCPLTIGGGVKKVEDVVHLLESGADKVSINSMLLSDADGVKSLCRTFGAQCIVASLDVVQQDAQYYLYDYRTGVTGLSLDSSLTAVMSSGCGELLLNRVDHDGFGNGFDLACYREVEQRVNMPVIACGGAGRYQDFQTLLEQTRFTAAAAGNIFFHSEISYARLKNQLNGLCIRKNTLFPSSERLL